MHAVRRLRPNAYPVLMGLQRSIAGKRILIENFNNWAIRHPLALAAIVSTSRAVLCDYFAQRYVEGRDIEHFNWSRFASMCVFGFAYSGICQYGVYNKIYPLLFRALSIQRGTKGYVICNTFLDNFVHSPLIYFPIFYIFRGMVYEQSVNTTVIKGALSEYFGNNFKEDNMSCLKLWIPAMMVTFSVCPMQYRVPWIQSIGIVWTFTMSMLRGDRAVNDDDAHTNIACAGSQIGTAEKDGDGDIHGGMGWRKWIYDNENNTANPEWLMNAMYS